VRTLRVLQGCWLINKVDQSSLYSRRVWHVSEALEKNKNSWRVFGRRCTAILESGWIIYIMPTVLYIFHFDRLDFWCLHA